MRLGNVILAIFLWLCIPASLVVGIILGAFAIIGGNNLIGCICCAIGLPVILFILGLVILKKVMDGQNDERKIFLRNKFERHYPSCGRDITEAA